MMCVPHTSSSNTSRSLLLAFSAALLLLLLPLGSCQLVTWPTIPSDATLRNGPSYPPVSNWLLTTQETGTGSIPGPSTSTTRAAWRKVGFKLWWFMSNMDHDWVDAANATVPQTFRVRRAFPAQCGRLTRLMIRMPFHDCGTFDVGSTGSEGDTGKARFGCNGSLRKEVGPCLGGPGCWAGAGGVLVDRRFNLVTGAWMNETAFAALEARFNTANKVNIDWAMPTNEPEVRFENMGFGMGLAILYQVTMEARAEGLSSVSYTDILMYAGLMAIAKCGGPHVEFRPGRTDASTADGKGRLPDPTEPLHANVAYFWANGVTNFDMVNLLAAHSTACFSIGCLDATPNKYDPDWAKKLLTVTSGSDSRICEFDGAGNPPKNSSRMCFLPADAEFAARADTRAYLAALTTTNSLDIAAAANNPAAPYNPIGTCPKPTGVACTTRTGDWTPFTVYSTLNLCNNALLAKNCPPTTGATGQRNLNNAVATSIFKMTHWFPQTVTVTVVGGVRFNITRAAGSAWGVKQQPCQPDLIKIGADEESLTSVCTCCPNKLAQSFDYIPPENRVAPTAAAVAAAAAVEVPVAAAVEVTLPGAEEVALDPTAAAAAVPEAVVTEAGPVAAAAAAAAESVLPRPMLGVTPVVDPAAAAAVVTDAPGEADSPEAQAAATAAAIAANANPIPTELPAAAVEAASVAAALPVAVPVTRKQKAWAAALGDTPW